MNNKMNRFLIRSIALMLIIPVAAYIVYVTQSTGIISAQLGLYGIVGVAALIYYIYAFKHVISLKGEEKKYTYKSMWIVLLMGIIGAVVIPVIYTVVLGFTF